MELQRSDQIKLVHDLNSALYHADAVAEYLKKNGNDDEMIVLQGCVTDKIRKSLERLMALSDENSTHIVGGKGI
jgi:hypothetical protein